MQKLIEGHKRFLAEVFPARKSHFHLLSEGQTPAWLFITCADSRVVPDLILGTEPGDLFIARSIGNVVPITSQDVDGVTATIEYSVEVLKVRHAIVCGHSDCGALKAALDRKSLANLPKARRWLDHGSGLRLPAAVESCRRRKRGTGVADPRQRGCATDEPACAAASGARRGRGPPNRARLVLRHPHGAHRGVRRETEEVCAADRIDNQPANVPLQKFAAQCLCHSERSLPPRWNCHGPSSGARSGLYLSPSRLNAGLVDSPFSSVLTASGVSGEAIMNSM